MNKYYCASEPDLRFYPNYSFEIGDVNGDGRMELAALPQNGNRVRVVDIENNLVLERHISNNGNWGTPLICMADINSDGCDEIIVPSWSRRGQAQIIAIDSANRIVMEREFDSCAKDKYGWVIIIKKRT